MEPKKQINLFLRSLMEELKELWEQVDAYDCHLKCRRCVCSGKRYPASKVCEDIDCLPLSIVSS
jgi:hypothetical protein